MNNKEDKIATSMVKYLCTICGDKAEDAIVINKILSVNMANKIKELHGQAIGFSENPCKKCSEDLKKAFMVIGYNPEKSNMKELPQGFYRTGHIVGVRKESRFVEEFIKDNDPKGYERGFTFMPEEAMIYFNLIKGNNDGD